MKKSIKDIDVKSKKVLVRVDFNVPMDEETGTITNVNRIIESFPTIDYLRDHDARVILCSHLGRPKGKVDKRFSLRPVALKLSEILNCPVTFAYDCVGQGIISIVDSMHDKDIVLLENLRFHAEEEANDPAFAKDLASLADIYCDDAFGTAHRKHASIVGVSQYLPSVCGFLMEKEITTLGSLLDNPKHPFGLMLGGAKVEDKVALIENVINKVDVIVIGGGMAATFLKAKGKEVGQSLLDTNIDQASYLLDLAAKHNVKVVLPVDVAVTKVGNNQAPVYLYDIDNIPSDKRIVDMGPRTIALFKANLANCETLFWNGPTGIYEIPSFAVGTHSMVEFVSTMKGQTVIGGGSTAEVVTNWGFAPKMSFVSTGGGASLKFLSGAELPGVSVLMNKE